MKIGIIIPDLHYPIHDKKYLKTLFALTKDVNPDYLIYLGDCFDAYGISQFARRDGIDMEIGVWQTHKEILGFKEVIYDPLKAMCKKGTEIYWTGGNHDEQRTREAIEQFPDRKQLLDLQTNFPDAKICQYNESIKIGKVFFTHGVYTNDAHAKKHTIAFEGNVVYGHTHTAQEYIKSTHGNNGTHGGFSMGCGCNNNPEYMKNRPNSWVQMIGVIYFHDDGNFNLYKIFINKGKAIFNNKLYK